MIDGRARAAARPCSAVQLPLLGGPCSAVQPQWLAGPCSSVQQVGLCSSVQLRAVQKITRESHPCSAGTFRIHSEYSIRIYYIYPYTFGIFSFHHLMIHFNGHHSDINGAGLAGPGD